MTNQTQIFSKPGIDSHNVPFVAGMASGFAQLCLTKGCTNIEIGRIVVTSDGTPNLWYTIQVNYNDPSLYG